MRLVRALLLLVVIASVGCGHLRQEKHTGPCQLVLVTGPRLWFQRPNKELFEMWFDNPPPFLPGAAFSDVTYVDDNADRRHFLKATFSK